VGPYRDLSMKIFVRMVGICYLWGFLGFLGSRILRADAAVPQRIQIGGFFAPLSPSNHLYKDQAEHLAAFVMAVNDINNKADGVFDDVLPNTTIEIAVGTENSLVSSAINAVALEASFGGKGVVAAVNTLHNEGALMVSQLLTKLKTATAVTVANSGQFNDKSIFPYTVNIRPIVSRQGMVLQNMICLSEVRKVVVFAATDADNMQMMSEFQDESICELDILAVISVRSELSDFSYEIEQAIPTGSRYFLMFLPTHLNALFIEQGYAAGLFHDNTVLYTTINGATNITQYFSPETDVSRVLTGFLFSKFYPNYYMGRNEMANDFAHRWRLQPSRAGSIVNGKSVCDTSTDDSGNYLYQVVRNKSATCTGLDFSGYTSSGSNIHAYTALTYDSTILIAKAIDAAINKGLDYEDPAVIYDLMVHNVSFAGASGPLRLFMGYPEYGFHGEGNRDAGTQYSFNNFHPDLYASGSGNFMVKIGVFDGHDRTFTSCAPVDNVECFLPTYSAMTDGSYNIPPRDTPPVIIQNISGAFSALCFAMTAIIVALVLIFGLFTAFNLRSKVIKASQPLLLCCILVGGLIAAARIALGGLPKDDGVCAAEIWCGHLTFSVMIGSLFVKSYRVHCVVNTKKLTRVTFSAAAAFRLLLTIVSAVVVYLIVLHAVGQPRMFFEAAVVANQETDIRFCELQYPQFQTALFIIEGLMLIISFRVCWEIRNVPDIVNESKQISTAMSVIVLISVLILPIVYFLGLPQETRELVASFGFGFGSIVTLVLLFVPKIMVRYQWNGAKISAKVAAEVMLSGKYRSVPANGHGDTAQADLEAEALLKGKTKEQKLLICAENMRRWQAMLLAQQRAAMDNSHSTSSNVDGVGHSKHMEPSIVSSVMDADLTSDVNGQLYTCGNGSSVDTMRVISSSMSSGAARAFAASESRSVYPGMEANNGVLEIQDV
jgi:hypothetical protein